MEETGNILLEPIPDSNPPKRKIKDSEWPDPAFVNTGVRGDLSEFNGARYSELATHQGEIVEAKFIDSVAKVLGRQMEKDSSVVVMGEDVHRLAGGTNGATKGLKDRFPDRILGTPISENAFTGLGGGIAIDGRFKPVVKLK